MKIRRGMSLLMVFAFVLVGFVAVQNAEALPLRKDWQKVKDKYKVKKGLAKVNMGKALDTYHKIAAKDDAKKTLGALKKLEKQVEGYIAAAKKKKADKGFIDYCENMLKDINQLQTIYESKINPLKIVKMRLSKAISAAKKLKADSPKDDFKAFYKEEYRLIGMALKDMVKKEPDFKDLASKFNANATKVNKALNDDKGFDTKEVLKDITDSLKSLNAAIKKF